MKTLMTTTAALALVATTAFAQNEATSTTATGMMGTADLSALPQACRDAASGGSATGATASTTDTSSGSATTDSTTSTETVETGTDTGADADPTAGDTTTAQTDTQSGSSTDTTTGSGSGTMMASGGMMGSEIDMMHGRLAQLQGIQDKDLAFACTMIAQHQGAVNMARSMEASLQDDEMKSMVTTMISAHESEIDRLTTWAEGHTTN